MRLEAGLSNEYASSQHSATISLKGAPQNRRQGCISKIAMPPEFKKAMAILMH
jgi:hypothetical protein